VGETFPEEGREEIIGGSRRSHPKGDVGSQGFAPADGEEAFQEKETEEKTERKAQALGPLEGVWFQTTGWKDLRKRKRDIAMGGLKEGLKGVARSTFIRRRQKIPGLATEKKRKDFCGGKKEGREAAKRK